MPRLVFVELGNDEALDAAIVGRAILGTLIAVGAGVHNHALGA
jgi:hypothetical protein